MALSEREARRRRQRRVVVVACIAAAVLVLALVLIGLLLRDDSDDDPGAFRTEAATTVDETTSTSTEPPTTTTTRGSRGSGEPVTFAFAGDVHFEGHLAESLAAGPESLLAPIAPVLSRADVAVVNLETAVTDRGTPAPKEYVFRASPAAFTALRGAGVDVVSMANNHGLDYGPVGLGLGNFVFYNESGPAGISGVLEVTATGREIDGYSWVPARLRNGVPVPLDGAPADADRAAWTALRDCTGLAL